ncbi:flavin reductase family protein [Cryptosporangium sp. NPDC048952]|uniref:flavin reductase family protein n=1 Tax=Cryptosporangium sp. NPDC048952 TaxID=3363961 RepID=UPI00371828BD
MVFPSSPQDVHPGRYFRDVLGNLPTGVVIVTARDPDDEPVGMVLGSFGSVSLDPPMVLFTADRGSTSFPKIQAAGRFVVNVLASDQSALCHAMATKVPDRFETARRGSSGAPVFDGIVAWIGCELADVIEAGDHLLVLGAVTDLQKVSDKHPLVFFRGGYGGFEPHAARLIDWFPGWG